jgi:hypothetical protein
MFPLCYNFTIREQNGIAKVVSASGTVFPSYEVWQYGGPGGPNLVYHYSTNGNVLDLRDGMKQLPLQ